MPLYSCIYYNIDDLNSDLGHMEAFTEQPYIWCCHLRTFVCTIKKKKRTIHNQLFRGSLWSVVRVVGVLFVLILEFSERKISHFLDDVHIVEALNEPVDDSGSEGDVSETEYSPSESDSDSGM